MTAKRRARTEQPRPKSGARPKRRTGISLRKLPASQEWELVHPRCALARADDLAQVVEMLEGGETEVAIDELRWLLNGCSDFLAGHRLLGEQALATGDVQLARGHFGYAFDRTVLAFPDGMPPGPIPYRLPANQAFLESVKGLAHCLVAQAKPRRALRVLRVLAACDPLDPLGAVPWIAELEAKIAQASTAPDVPDADEATPGRASGPD